MSIRASLVAVAGVVAIGLGLVPGTAPAQVRAGPAAASGLCADRHRDGRMDAGDLLPAGRLHPRELQPPELLRPATSVHVRTDDRGRGSPSGRPLPGWTRRPTTPATGVSARSRSGSCSPRIISRRARTACSRSATWRRSIRSSGTRACSPRFSTPRRRCENSLLIVNANGTLQDGRTFRLHISEPSDEGSRGHPGGTSATDRSRELGRLNSEPAAPGGALAP